MVRMPQKFSFCFLIAEKVDATLFVVSSRTIPSFSKTWLQRPALFSSIKGTRGGRFDPPKVTPPLVACLWWSVFGWEEFLSTFSSMAVNLFATAASWLARSNYWNGRFLCLGTGPKLAVLGRIRRFPLVIYFADISLHCRAAAGFFPVAISFALRSYSFSKSFCVALRTLAPFKETFLSSFAEPDKVCYRFICSTRLMNCDVCWRVFIMCTNEIGPDLD